MDRLVVRANLLSRFSCSILKLQQGALDKAHSCTTMLILYDNTILDSTLRILPIPP